jgi:3-phenylpropionate/trans-cinnamate dioxygenase subunit beta
MDAVFTFKSGQRRAGGAHQAWVQSGELFRQGIINDTKDQLERRIARLETGMAWAEEPPSRTRHLISNCQISETDIPNVFAVRVNYLLYRAQKERDETFYVGTRFDKVRRLEDDNWRLLERDIVLDQAVITSHNLSVLF